MKTFYGYVVKYRKTILTCFFVFAVFCAFAKNLVAVNYDMNDYLPEDAKSTVALDVMEREFEGGIPNARVMIRDISIPEALEYKEKLEAVDGVTEVTWLDDATDVTVPVDTLDTDTVETYYKDNTALLTVTIEEESRVRAAADIREIIGDANAMSGSAVSAATATTSTVSEIQKITVIVALYSGTANLLNGIVELYDATGTLHDGAGQLDDGVAEMVAGISTLYDGAGELYDGTGELRTETSGMDTEIEDKIDELLDTVTGDDLEITSFVSDKNTNVDSVQFVIKTDSLETEETEEVVHTNNKKMSIWQKFLNLFGLYDED